MDKNDLCFPSSGSTDHSRSTREVLPSKLAKFAVHVRLPAGAVPPCLQKKIWSLFQNHHKDFTNQLGHTCIIVNRCCLHVCIPLCVRTFTKSYLNLELQHCFTSGLLIKATEGLLGLAWSKLQSTNTSSSESDCSVCTVWCEEPQMSEQLLPTVLFHALLCWEMLGWIFSSGESFGTQCQHWDLESSIHWCIETNCFSTEWPSWTCSHENQHMLSPQLAPFSRDGLLSRLQGMSNRVV